MGLPVRTVCVACLHSLEISSAEGWDARATCPYCGRPIDLRRSIFDSTTGDGFNSPPPADLEAPTPKVEALAKPTPGRIGRFELRDLLGEGGYGQVFRAFDPQLERDVALKVLKPHRLGEKSLERFYREARAAARLDHPNIVGLHDAGRDEGRCWIAYQLVPGQTLSMVRDVDRPSIDAVVRIVRDLALALHHAHGRGVFHRDLKPANILVDDSGRARLTDFGLARRNDLDSDLTQEGTVLGTPQYMSPEAASGRAREADGRSDLYSLGVILYELICGRRPADVPSGVPLWRSTRMTSPRTPRSVDRAIPIDLDRICMKALAFEPDARFPDGRSFAQALDGYLQGRSAPGLALKSNQKGGLAIGLIVVASVLCLVLGMSLHVASRDGSEPVPSGPSSGAIPPATDRRQDRSNLDPPAREPRPRDAARVARKPVPDPANLWDQPVVWIRGTAGFKFHLASGCQSTRETPRERWVEVGDAREAKLAGYLPCGHCLKYLGQAPPPDPAGP